MPLAAARDRRVRLLRHLRDNAADPQHIGRYDPARNPHEFYLWVDPDDAARALLYISATSSNRLLLTDISRARDGVFEELVNWEIPAPGGDSMTPTVDGRETYLAYLTGGYYIADTAGVVDGAADPTPRLITPHGGHVDGEGPGAHSALRVPGRDVALVTDEVYGEALRALGHGCRWGWTRFVDVSDPTQLEVIGEYKLEQNEREFCATDVPRPVSSYSAHNPTATDELAFITWHAGGLRAVSFDDPMAPVETRAFVPEPLPFVLREDPALTAGQDKVAMWSFPIVQTGSSTSSSCATACTCCATPAPDRTAWTASISSRGLQPRRRTALPARGKDRARGPADRPGGRG